MFSTLNVLWRTVYLKVIWHRCENCLIKPLVLRVYDPFKATKECSVVVSSILLGNYQRKMPTSRCMLRKRATRRNGWVAPMKSWCGVFKRASWVLECLPPSRPFIDQPLVQLHPPDNSLSLDECLSHPIFSHVSHRVFWLGGTEGALTPLISEIWS